MAEVLLENANAGWTKRIACNSVQPSYQKNNNGEPDQQTGEVTTVTENTFENPTYNVQGWQINPDVTYSAGDGALTISDMISLHTSTSTELYLHIKYGSSQTPGGEKTYPSTQSAYPNKIPVVIDQFQPTLSTGDSQDAYAPVGQITFRETRGPNTTI